MEDPLIGTYAYVSGIYEKFHGSKQENSHINRNLKVLLGITALTLVVAAIILPHGLFRAAQMEQLPAFGNVPSSPLPADQISDRASSTDTAIAAPSRIAIPSIGVNVAVVNAPRTAISWDVSHLAWQVGHLEGTAYPGQGGNVVFGAHRYLGATNFGPSSPGPFVAADRLQPGDSIQVTAGGHVYVYTVTQQFRVSPNETWVAYPSDHEVLTLITCDTWNPQSLSFDKRLVVRADLVEVR